MSCSGFMPCSCFMSRSGFMSCFMVYVVKNQQQQTRTADACSLGGTDAASSPSPGLSQIPTSLRPGGGRDDFVISRAQENFRLVTPSISITTSLQLKYTHFFKESSLRKCNNTGINFFKVQKQPQLPHI